MHKGQSTVSIISVNDTCDLEEKDTLNLTDHEAVLTAAVVVQSRQICLVHTFPFCTPHPFSYIHLEADSDDLGLKKTKPQQPYRATLN